jgi:hypothetical protein
MGEGGTCPSDLLYEVKSYATLLRVGAAMSDEVSLTPDWRFFMASVAGFFALVLFSAMFISYIYNKNWDQDPSRRAVRYQAKQYKKVRRSDIKDVKALVSINSEASSFSFQQSGSSETFEAKAEQNAKKNKD